MRPSRTPSGSALWALAQPRPIAKLATGILERNPNRKLQLPRKVRLTVDLSEGAARQIRVRRIKIGRVEGVERFGPELRLEPLFKLEVLEDGDVPVLLTGTAQPPNVRGVLPNEAAGTTEKGAGLM